MKLLVMLVHLEDGAAVSEIQSVFNELQKNIQNQKQLISNHLVLFLHLHLMQHLV